MTRFLGPLTLVIVTLYLTLAVGAAGCLFDPVQPNVPSHHHHTHATHSAFCAWVCQGNPTVGAIVETPFAPVFQLVVLLVLVRSSKPMRVVSYASHSRAPPR